MLTKSQYILTSISFSITVLSFVVGFIYFRYLKKNKSIFYLVLISALFEILNLFFFSSNSSVTIYLSQFFTVLEFLLLFHFYANYFKTYFKTNYYYLIPLLFLIGSTGEFIFGSTNSIDSYSIIIESVFFIIVSLLSFAFIIKNLIQQSITNNPFFWVNSAVLIYFSGNILLFLFYKSIKPNDFFTLYVFLHSSLNIIYNSLLCISFYKSKQL